jgi:hypothetical protein
MKVSKTPDPGGSRERTVSGRGIRMSWDVLLLRLPEGVGSLEELAEDSTPPALGPRAEVVTALCATEPDIELPDPTYGQLAGADWSMELHIGAGDPIDTIMLCVRGKGDDVVARVVGLATALDCHAFPTSGGEVLDPADTASWHADQAARERVVLGWTF